MNISGVRKTGTKFNQAIENTQHLRIPTPGLKFLFDNFNMDDVAIGNVIDYGAGGGRDTRAFLDQDKGWDVHAVDISAKSGRALSIEIGEGKVKFHQTGRLQDLPLPHQSVSVVNAQRVLPFLPRDELTSMLTESANLLRPGGYLCVSFFGLDHSWNNGTRPDCNFYSKDDINDLLGEAGFVVVREKHQTGPSRTAAKGVVDNWDEITVVAKSSIEPAAPEQVDEQQQAGNAGDCKPCCILL